MRALMTWPVLLSVANYALLAMLDIAFRAIQPLFYSTPVHLGGLGQTPARIGTTLAAFGVINGVFQALFFAKLIKLLGPRRLFLVGLGMYIALFGMFPVINGVVRDEGMSVRAWCLIMFQLCLVISCDMAYGEFSCLT